MTTGTQKQYADHLGKDKSYVTRLKGDGRLVFAADGLVDFEASDKRVQETAGGRDDVAARHAAARTTTPQPALSPNSETRANAQARKEAAEADKAEMERDQMRGLLIEREQVEQALADVVSLARQSVENLPHRVGAQLVGKDFDQIVALLRQEIVSMMADTHKEVAKRLGELAPQNTSFTNPPATA